MAEESHGSHLQDQNKLEVKTNAELETAWLSIEDAASHTEQICKD